MGTLRRRRPPTPRHSIININMKHLVILSCLVAVGFCAPQLLQEEEDKEKQVEILNQEFSLDGANFRSGFLGEDQTSFAVIGVEGTSGQSNQKGSYKYTQDDGTVAELRYTADENGFKPDSALLPVAPPAPQHVQDMLRFIARQQAAGRTWDQDSNSWV